jgi:hypothetical protein
LLGAQHASSLSDHVCVSIALQGDSPSLKTG